MKILMIVLLLSTAVAWDFEVHEALAGEACDFLHCGECKDIMVNASTEPDWLFKDQRKHHYYSTAWNCPEGNWTCPKHDDFIALEKVHEWLLNSTIATACNKYYAIGVASHYFYDSKVFWHRVQKEPWWKHKQWEEDVGLIYGEDFTYSKYGVTISSADFKVWKAEFYSMLEDYKYNSTVRHSLRKVSKKPSLIEDLLRIVQSFVTFISMNIGKG